MNGRDIDLQCDSFEAAWQRDETPRLEDFLIQTENSSLFEELLRVELSYRKRRDDRPLPEEYQSRFPQFAELVPHCFQPRQLSASSTVEFLKATAAPSAPSVAPLPASGLIGRYRVERVLGQGGFGVVYLAQDDELMRPIAIKVPHPHLIAVPEELESYRAEARTVASLDHAHIVPVYDIGSSAEFPIFVVSKYIDGADLASRLKSSRLSLQDALKLLANVAEALHYAHKQGLVHRDIKPGNILLDQHGKAFVADFGMALREQDAGKGSGFVGTPAYMSPEQARGEGHRVDGRSDIYSVGVILYELLTGRLPFRADSTPELLHKISRLQVRPPRQVDDSIPKELERICLKALAKRSSDRYSTAHDMAEDLRCFISETTHLRKTSQSAKPQFAANVDTPVIIDTPQVSDGPPVKIMPKGLHSFDAADADFFLELLPGPRDRDGLPESIRFWKNRIESADADQTFPVGLLYGPSGCGKSSLMRAGLIPRLSKQVLAVQIEATADETEQRLLRALRRQLADLPTNLGLIESLALVRKGRYLEPGQKVLLVIDQFEQWLHAWSGDDSAELVQALRQCDGVRVQCIVMVRDDFWLAVSRFMKNVEVEIVEGRNSALVDLFDLLHARGVLASFGRAYGRLPAKVSACSKEQMAFLDQAIAGLDRDGKVVPVRLALFAEMVKGKPWTPATLAAVGGTKGIGVRFLEETFAASSAPPEYRVHRQGAQAVLQALLPPAGTNIKGHMRSQRELLEASTYGERPADFAQLIRILDSQVRLISPTESEQSHAKGQQYYQLTHDYLVPALREWLTLKQRETLRGRAALELAERSSIWNARPINQHLPSLAEYVRFTLFTNTTQHTSAEQKLMVQAGRYHRLRGLLTTCILVVVLAGVYGTRQAILHDREHRTGAARAAGLVTALLNADIAQVPRVVEQINDVRQWADPLLTREFDAAAENSPQKVHAALALVSSDSRVVPYLRDQLLVLPPKSFAVVRESLMPHASSLVDPLWQVAENNKHPPRQRLQAACALAHFAPEEKRWPVVGEAAASWLAKEDATTIASWIAELRPAGQHLFDPLRRRFAASADVEERLVIASALAHFGAGRDAEIVTLIRDADMRHVPYLVRPLQNDVERIAPLLVDLLSETDPSLAKEALINPPAIARANSILDRLAQCQARAAAALLLLGKPEHFWPALKQEGNPRLRTYLIHQAHHAHIDPNLLLRELSQPHDPTILQAILLALGEYSPDALTEPEQVKLRLREQHNTLNDAGVRSGIEWLCLQWKWTEVIRDGAKSGGPGRNWLESPAGDRLVVLQGPLEFEMGLPYDVNFAEHRETRHTRWIGRSYAIATKETTRNQFAKYLHAKGIAGHQSQTTHFTPTEDCPVVEVSWYEAAAYCNWLNELEQIPREEWCYLPNSQDQYAPGMRHAPNYLERRGYRLPTEAEWEYACAGGASGAGAGSAYHFGSDENLLPKYGWFTLNSPHVAQPVAQLRPNPFGLFDMHGNVVEWCSDGPQHYPMSPFRVVRDLPDEPQVITDVHHRSIRGGQFPRDSQHSFTTRRRSHSAAARYGGDGFRIARTVPSLQPIVFVAGQQVQGKVDDLESSNLTANAAEFEVIGSGEPFRVSQIQGGIDVEPKTGKTPATLRVSAPNTETRGYEFVVENPASGSQTRLRGVLLFPTWKLKFYEWKPAENGPAIPESWDAIFASAPVLDERAVGSLAFNWGAAAPSEKVRSDYFAVTADCELELPDGELEFRVQCDDGLQIYVDDSPLKLKWFHVINERIHVTAGRHRLRVIYAEVNALAELQLSLRMHAATR